MATIVPPPGVSRAREILRDMRQKREHLVSSNPSLQKSQKGQKPPTVPRKKQLPSSSPGTSRAREILGDMQLKRASLSAVLEAVKQAPGSPSSRRSNRSLGPSTAPTAASTRSWLSSNADDDSFCYSETSFEDSPKESSIEFIIDTEDSDFSLTTKEEVEDAIGAIYDEVIPEALKLAKKQAKKQAKKEAKKEAKQHAVETATEKTITTTSWTFQTQSSARNLYREESYRVSKSEKKKRRVKLSDMKEQLQSDQRQSSRSHASGASGVETIDLNEVRKQRSRLQEMMESISELKEAEGPPKSRTRSTRSIRRLRQDDASEGSAPISTKSSRKKTPSSASVEISDVKVDFDLSAMKEQSRREKNANSSLASHYVIETKVKRGHRKKVVVKPAELYVAPTPDPSNLQSDSSSSEASLLASPNFSSDENDDEESLLVSPQHSEDERSRSEPVKMEETPEVWLLEPPKNDLSDLTYPDIQSRGSVDNLSPIDPVVDYECEQITTEFQSEESAFILLEEYKISEDEPASILGERRCSTVALAPEKCKMAALPTVSQSMEFTPIEPRTGSTPPSDDDLVNYMKTYTMDDIVREMNLIAAKIGNEGLKIPTGTVIKLRHNDGEEEDDMEDESATGWTFAEPSDMSTCSYTLPRTNSTRCAPDSTTVDFPGKPPVRSSRREKDVMQLGKGNAIAEQDITERYCGGMYHLAIMTGMPAYERQEV